MMSVWSGELSVDTFFFLSGFLVSYSMTKAFDKMKRRVNIVKMSFMMYLHRYIRWGLINIVAITIHMFFIVCTNHWRLKHLSNLNIIFYRLTPAYACLMLIFSSLILHVGNGPNWILVENQVKGCTENWWKNLLYINNMFKE